MREASQDAASHIQLPPQDEDGHDFAGPSNQPARSPSQEQRDHSRSETSEDDAILTEEDPDRRFAEDEDEFESEEEQHHIARDTYRRQDPFQEPNSDDETEVRQGHDEQEDESEPEPDPERGAREPSEEPDFNSANWDSTCICAPNLTEIPQVFTTISIFFGRAITLRKGEAHTANSTMETGIRWRFGCRCERSQESN